jgi:hypothetical protein
MLERVHAAKVAAVRIVGFISAANTLDERDFVWFLPVGLADNFATCGTSREN